MSDQGISSGAIVPVRHAPLMTQDVRLSLERIGGYYAIHAVADASGSIVNARAMLRQLYERGYLERGKVQPGNRDALIISHLRVEKFRRYLERLGVQFVPESTL